VVVLLPTKSDWIDTTRNQWRRDLVAAAAREEYLFVDLQDDLRRIAADSLDLLFYAPHNLESHYGEAGHRWVADRLYQHLLAYPKTAAFFAR
jgi:hypothetical protein